MTETGTAESCGTGEILQDKAWRVRETQLRQKIGDLTRGYQGAKATKKLIGGGAIEALISSSRPSRLRAFAFGFFFGLGRSRRGVVIDAGMRYLYHPLRDA
jgi:hypothetical protein